MEISLIYQRYSITSTLQQHMLRAASVGAYIAEHWKGEEPIDDNAIISAMLLHDTGNIIKFDLEKFPHLLGSEIDRVEHWKNIQQEFIKKYGKEEHLATNMIAKELGISDRVYSLLTSMGTTNLHKILLSNDFNQKVCIYSDMRCAPFGIVGVHERFDELLERYKGRNHGIANVEKTETNRKYCLEIEKQLQTHVNFPLIEISDEIIEPYMKKLRHFSVLTR